MKQPTIRATAPGRPAPQIPGCRGAKGQGYPASQYPKAPRSGPGPAALAQTAPPREAPPRLIGRRPARPPHVTRHVTRLPGSRRCRGAGRPGAASGGMFSAGAEGLLRQARCRVLPRECPGSGLRAGAGRPRRPGPGRGGPGSRRRPARRGRKLSVAPGAAAGSGSPGCCDLGAGPLLRCGSGWEVTRRLPASLGPWPPTREAVAPSSPAARHAGKAGRRRG